jgi:hypothetical protein
MVLMVALHMAGRFGWGLGPIHIEQRVHPEARPVAAEIGDGTLLLFLIAMLQLSRMLGRIAWGELFSASVVRSFRAFALWLLLAALFRLLAPIVAAFFDSFSNRSHMVLILDFPQVLTVGTTLLLFLIARLLEHARRLDEEIREFV